MDMIQNVSQTDKVKNDDSETVHTYKIYASDRDDGAVRATMSNAKRAGVLPYIQTKSCAFTKHPLLSVHRTSPLVSQEPQERNETTDKLFIISNLPFGRRISTIKQKPQNYAKHPLLPIYQSLGNHINAMTDIKSDHQKDIDVNLSNVTKEMNVMLLTDDRELVRHGGFHKPLTTKLTTTHGGIPVSGMFLQTGNHQNIETSETSNSIDVVPTPIGIATEVNDDDLKDIASAGLLYEETKEKVA